MAKKKTVKIDGDNFDLNLEKEGKKIKVEIDTKNVDVEYIQDEVRKEFHYDGKNIDIDVEKTPEGLEVKVDAKPGIWKIIAKKIVKFILKRFKK